MLPSKETTHGLAMSAINHIVNVGRDPLRAKRMIEGIFTGNSYSIARKSEVLRIPLDFDARDVILDRINHQDRYLISGAKERIIDAI